MNKVMLIFQKDWQEVRQSLGLMATLIVLPLFFTIFAIAVVLLFGLLGGAATSATKSGPQDLYKMFPQWRGYPEADLVQGLGALESQMFFLIIPFTITLTIASYSVVGEKQNRTLEPLLATPIETWQLLLGKALVSVIPGVVATWLAYSMFVVIIKLFAGYLAADIVTGAPYLILVFLLTPLITILIVLFCVIISSRVNDARTAQQIAGVVIVPLILIFVAQLVGIVSINVPLALIICLVTLLLDLGALWLATALFQRETILTRWK